MFIVIVGGGKLGYYLTKTLLSYNHKVTVVEEQLSLCKKIANDFNIPVVNGDGTRLEHLSDAGIGNADMLIAVTGRDEDNLVVCQLAKRNFSVGRTIARVNNPKNIRIFERLGVDTAVSSTAIIADLIEKEVDYSGMRTLLSLKGGKIVLNEIVLNEKSPVINKKLKDINLPKDCIVMSVIREEEIIIPNGFTALSKGDYIIIVSSEERQADLREYLLG